MHVLTNFDNDSLNPFISACDKGYYGTACNETCGQCDELEQCSNINGSCLTGCNAGYLGETCETRKYIDIAHVHQTIYKNIDLYPSIVTLLWFSKI